MAFIKVYAEIDMDVGDKDGEDICMTFERGLETAVAHFPEAEVVGARVDRFEKITDEQAENLGYVEE